VTALAVDGPALLRALAALACVLLLTVPALWLLRRHAAGPLRRLGAGSRLCVTASQPVDARVRLVLVRRDAVEHLLAIGPAGVTVIETLPAAAGPEAPGAVP
jgi:flagellar protein FliO/FliZ